MLNVEPSDYLMKLRKTISTFFISWLMLFTQMIAFAEEGPMGRAGDEYTRRELDRRNPQRVEVRRRRAAIRSEIEFRRQTGRFSPLCSPNTDLEYLIPGISELVTHVRDNTCSINAVLANSGSSRPDGNIDVVKYCQHLDTLAEQNVCSIQPVGNGIMEMLGELRNDTDLMAKEMELKERNVAEYANELKDVATLQMAISTNNDAVTHMFSMIWQEAKGNAEIKARYKALFNLPDTFFEGQNSSPMAVEDFIKTAFQCLPYDSTKYDNGDNYQGKLSAAHKVSCGDPASDNLLNQAKASAVNNCMAQGENCFFRHASPDQLFENIHEDIAQSIYDRGDMFAGNPALIGSTEGNQVVGLNHLGQVHFVTSEINRDRDADGNVVLTTRLAEAARNAGWNGSGAPAEGVVGQMRTVAFNRTMELLRSQSNALGSSTPNRTAIFENFVNSLKGDNGYLDPSRNYTLGPLKRALRDSMGNESTSEEELTKIAGYVQMLAIGQRMADSYIENQQEKVRFYEAHGDAVNSGNNHMTNFFTDLSDGAQSILDDVRQNNIRDPRVVAGRIVGDLNRGQPLKGIFAAAGAFEANQSLSNNPAERMAYGARNVASLIKDADNSIFDRMSMMRERLGRNFTTDQRVELTQLEAIRKMAIRSAQSCNKLQQGNYIKSKFCSPMSEPAYGAKGIEALLGRADSMDNGEILKGSRVLCTSVLKEKLENDLEAANIDKHSDQMATANFNFCQNRMRGVFCEQGASCNLNNLEEHQVNLLGQTCNRDSVNDGDYATNTAARIASGQYGETPPIETASVEVDPTKNVVGTVSGGTFDSLANSAVYSSSGRKRDAGRPQFGGASGGSSASSERRLPDNYTPVKGKESFADQAFASQGTGTLKGTSMTEFVPPSAIDSSLARDVLEVDRNSAAGEERLSPTTRALLERLSAMEERQGELLARIESGNANDADKERLASLKEELAAMRRKLSEQRDFQTVAATVGAQSTPAPTPTDGLVSTGFSGRRRNGGGASRGPANVNNVVAPVPANAGGGAGPSGFEGGATFTSLRGGGAESGNGGTYELRGTPLDGIVLNLSEVKGVDERNLTRIGLGQMEHAEVLQMIQDNPQNVLLEVGEGEFLLYVAENVDGEIKVRVSLYNENGEKPLTDYDGLTINAASPAVIAAEAAETGDPESILRLRCLDKVLEGDAECLQGQNNILPLAAE